MSLPKQPRTRMYVVVRYDAAATEPERQFTAEEVVDSDVLAQSEVERLGGLGENPGVRYFYQTARLHRPGLGGAGAAPKAPPIRAALRQLRDGLGEAFEVVDHWPTRTPSRSRRDVRPHGSPTSRPSTRQRGGTTCTSSARPIRRRGGGTGTAATSPISTSRR
jgi:hypothetical protein